MTVKEAINHLHTFSSTNGSGQTTRGQHEEAKRMAIAALEKQIPQKTGIPELGISKHYPIIIPCGNCGMELTDRMWSYCPWCGQAVRWGNDD